jgi:eukaryotic-like serine/threonine-protein kinase
MGADPMSVAPTLTPEPRPDDTSPRLTRLQPEPARPGPAAPWKRHARRTGEIALAALVGGTVVAVWPRPEPGPARFSRITFRRGAVDSARFMPDGQVAYCAAFDDGPRAMYAARVDTREWRVLPLPPARLVSISRTGEVAFVRGETLVRAPLSGGPAKVILENVATADATPDGNAFAVARRLSGGRARIEYPVGTVLGEAASPSHLRLDASGERVAFLEHPLPGDDRGLVVVLDRAGKRQVLTDEWASVEGLAWSPRGDTLYFSAARVGADCALHAVRLDGRLRTVAPALGRLVIHDIAPDGRVLLERNTLRAEVRFQRADEPRERDLSWFDLSQAVALSSDGQWLLFGETGEGGGPEYGVYLRRTDGSPPVRLGPGRAMDLSQDGRLALAIPLARPDRIDLLTADGRAARPLRYQGLTRYEWAGFLPDGQSLLFTARAGDGPPRVYAGSLQGGAARPITPEGVGLWRNAISPDGTRIIALEAGSYRLYPVSGGPGDAVPGLDSGFFPAAWGGPQSLLLREWRRASNDVQRLDLRTGERQSWRGLEPYDHVGVTHVGRLAVAPDEKAWAYTLHRRLSELFVAEGLLR